MFLAFQQRLQTLELNSSPFLLQAAPELLKLLKDVEGDYSRFTHPEGGLTPRRPEGVYAELIPFLQDQAQDWLAAAFVDYTGVLPSPVSLGGFSLWSWTYCGFKTCLAPRCCLR